jgi:hypothetical protein
MKKKIIFAIAAATAMATVSAPAAAKVSFPLSQCVTSDGSIVSSLAGALGKLFGWGAINQDSCYY